MTLELLEVESRAEILREFSKLIVSENIRLKQENADLKKQSAQSQDQMRLSYQDKLVKLQSKFFDQGQEKLDKELRSRKTKDVLPHGESLNPSSEPKTKKKAKDRKLPETTVIHEMTDSELEDESRSRGFEDSNASDWKEMPGLFDESSEITIIERVFQKTIHKKKKYIFKPSVGSEKEIIVAANGPQKLAPGSGFSIDFAIAVTCDKFQYHMPLNRQIDQMERKGLVSITAKTLYKLSEVLSNHARRAGVIEKIRNDILNAPLAVHADETPWPILDDHDSDGYLWTICNMAGAYYQFEPSRSGKIILEMLKGFDGPVLSDEFSGYNRVKNETTCTLSHCWSHARRNFYDIRKNHFDDCREIILMIDEHFSVEREAGPSFEKLKTLRSEKSHVIIDRIKTWLDEKNPKYLLEEDEMGKAIRYLLKRWPEFTLFLKDIRVPLSNNHAERSLRHSVVGRKNFYGSKTINGADVAADHYTIIETCKLVNLDPASYYRYMMKMIHENGEVLSPLSYVRLLWEEKKKAA